MLARRRVEPAAPPLDRIAELNVQLRDQIEGLSRPERLIKAENALVEARMNRVAVWERMTAAIAENQRCPTLTRELEVKALHAELAGMDTTISRRKAMAREQRAAFAPEVDAIIQPIMKEAAREGMVAAQQLISFRRLLDEASRAAAAVGGEFSTGYFTLPDLSPTLSQLAKLADEG